jgi:hypothetical protein
MYVWVCMRVWPWVGTHISVHVYVCFCFVCMHMMDVCIFLYVCVCISILQSVVSSRMEMLKELKSAAAGNKNFLEWYLSETTIQLTQMKVSQPSIVRLSDRFTPLVHSLFHVAGILSQPKKFRVGTFA